jgi:PKD repeat protein
VVPAPEITCSADSFVSGLPTFFEAEVTSGGLAPFEYYWSFGDGSLGFGESVQHIYQNAGVYTATVDVRDSLGCSVSCQTFMTISPNISASFSVDTLNGCAPFEVYFTNLSENAVTNYWSFGDGTGSNAVNPTHVYNAPGTYNVSLWIYAGNGNDSVSVSSQIVVNPSPVANFHNYEINPGTGSDTVQFADNSLFADSWLWDFGDPASGPLNSSTEQSPVHIFTSNGSFDVTLWVTNNYGCTDSITLSSAVSVGIEELSDDLESVIYPNPATDWIEVALYSDNSQSIELVIVNATGKNVIRRNLKAINGLNRFRFDLKQLSAGPYVMQLQSNGNKVSRSFVVTK